MSMKTVCLASPRRGPAAAFAASDSAKDASAGMEGGGAGAAHHARSRASRWGARGDKGQIETSSSK